MPKIDIAAVPRRKGVGYPAPFAAPCAERVRQRLGDAGALADFGVNLMRLPPSGRSSHRHWHSHEDEQQGRAGALLALFASFAWTRLKAEPETSASLADTGRPSAGRH